MAYFNFNRLIEKYTTEFIAVIPSAGEFDDTGKWVDSGETKQTLQGAIIGFTESKLFRSEGTLTVKDKHLFMLEPIDKALLGATVIYENEKFSITDDKSANAKFTGVYSYVLKFNSAFNEV